MKKIYLTVDTECHDIKRHNQYIEGIVNGKPYGLEKILMLCEELKIPVNIFFDMCEYREYGEEYAKNIIALVKKYNQTLCFHMHPDYISGDKSRSFLWQYNYDEKKDIIEKGFADYEKLTGEMADIFRVGRYGADEEMYKIFEESGFNLTELSYCSYTPKMCHVTNEQTGTYNAPVRYHNQLLLPNTRFKAFSLFGREKYINLDTNDSTYNEFSRFINKTELENVTLTMHSWNFIDKYFFNKNYVGGNKRAVKKFKKMVLAAQKAGFEFCSLRETPPTLDSIKDERIDLCKGFSGKLQMLGNNFVRFQKIAKLNKKYFLVYAAFYSLLILLIILLIIFLF